MHSTIIAKYLLWVFILSLLSTRHCNAQYSNGLTTTFRASDDTSEDRFIHIASVIDRNSIKDFLIAMHSAVYSSKTPSLVFIHVVCVGIDINEANFLYDQADAALENCMSENKREVVPFVLPKESGFRLQMDHSILKHHHWNSPAGADFVRFYLPSLFPHTSRILYLDNDIVVNCCLEEIYDTDFGETGVVGLALDDLKWTTATQFKRHYNRSVSPCNLLSLSLSLTMPCDDDDDDEHSHLYTLLPTLFNHPMFTHLAISLYSSTHPLVIKNMRRSGKKAAYIPPADSASTPAGSAAASETTTTSTTSTSTTPHSNKSGGGKRAAKREAVQAKRREHKIEKREEMRKNLRSDSVGSAVALQGAKEAVEKALGPNEGTDGENAVGKRRLLSSGNGLLDNNLHPGLHPHGIQEDEFMYHLPRYASPPLSLLLLSHWLMTVLTSLPLSLSLSPPIFFTPGQIPQ